MPIYMNYNNIPGDATASGHTNWIELNSFLFRVGRGISSPVGAAADRESSAPSFSEIVVNKISDVSSPKLDCEALQGEGQKVQIDFCKTEKGNLEIYTSYILTNCILSSYTVSSAGDRPCESLTLNFTRLEMKNVKMAADGDAGSPESVTYDIGLAKVV